MNPRFQEIADGLLEDLTDEGSGVENVAGVTSNPNEHQHIIHMIDNDGEVYDIIIKVAPGTTDELGNTL